MLYCSIRSKDLGETEAECIIAIDDECFTYNARVNRMNPIAEHKMIMKAVQAGVRPERIAATLNLPVGDVKSCMKLLDGINEEAVGFSEIVRAVKHSSSLAMMHSASVSPRSSKLLKDKVISPNAIRLLKKVTGVRQIEIAELMVMENPFGDSIKRVLPV